VTYDLRAALAGAPLIAAIAGRFQHATTVPLNQGLALIPASGPWLREVGGPGEQRPYPVFEFLTRPLAGFLREASVRSPVAYIEIEEMQDRTFEAAVAWSGGELALPPQVLQPGEALPPGGGPVAEAVRRLGAIGQPGPDERASLGLYQFRHTQEWLEVPGLIRRLPEMELAWGQPGEQWAGFDFQTDYHTRAGGYPFRLRVGPAPGGARYTVTFWQRTVLELAHLPGGWRLARR
jgi:hypothetical protein